MMQSDQDRRTEAESAPWLEPVAEEYVRSRRALFAPRALIVGLSLGVAALFGGLVWMVYSHGEVAGEPLYVAAPTEPFKVEPTERGGMEFPHRDKLVFNRLSGERESGEERLRPLPEAAVERPDVPDLDLATPAPAEVVGGARIERAATEQEPAAQRTLDRAGIPRDQWAVQVAAFRQKNDARTWMIKTKYDHEGVFGDLVSEIVEGRRDMATYFRVRFGPLPDRQAALDRCERVRAIRLNCIVVKPE